MKNLDNIKLPYVLKNKVLVSPGIWNNITFTKESIKRAHKTANYTKENRALYEDHDDREVGKYIGEVRNIKLKGSNLVGDLFIVDKDTATKLAFGAHFGISPKIAPFYTGKDEKVLKSYDVANFSVVIKPAIKKAYINNNEVNLMASEEDIKEEVEDSEIPEEVEFAALKDIIKKAKKIRKEGESWKAAIKRAAKMLAEMEDKEFEEVEFASLKDILKKAKEIRKEGEPWKDAVARAKKLLAGEEKAGDKNFEEEELEIFAALKDILKKAKEIRKEGEPWKEAVKRATKMLKGKKEEPEEESENLSDECASVLDDLVQTYENLSEGDNFDDTIGEIKNVLESLKKVKPYKYPYKYPKKKYPYKYPKKQSEEESFDIKGIIEALKKIRAGAKDDEFKAQLAAVIAGLTKGAGKYPYPKMEDSDVFELNDKIVGALKEAEKEIEILSKVKGKLTTDNLSLSRKLQKFQSKEQEDKKLKFNQRVKDALDKYVKYFDIKGEEVKSTEKMLSNFSEDMLERTINHLEKKQLTTLEAQPRISTRPSEELRTVVTKKRYDKMTAKEKTNWLFENMAKK